MKPWAWKHFRSSCLAGSKEEFFIQIELEGKNGFSFRVCDIGTYRERAQGFRPTWEAAEQAAKDAVANLESGGEELGGVHAA